MLNVSKTRGSNVFSNGYERQEVKVVIHQPNLNNYSRLKFMGNVIKRDSDRVFKWSITF